MWYHSYFPHSMLSFLFQISIALLKDVDSPSLWGDIEISTGCHRSEYSWTVNTKIRRLLITDLNGKWGYSLSRDDNKVGSLTDHYNAIGASINEGLTQISTALLKDVDTPFHGET
ncbi:hypothetical protein V1477_002411 [Vespula maculifrons]|uniref:Uncharacterized protein n=1 Tax=Vespula maculifrons TaxID=7453 RepID=A0ABD2CWE7_VESMC